MIEEGGGKLQLVVAEGLSALRWWRLLIGQGRHRLNRHYDGLGSGIRQLPAACKLESFAGLQINGS